MIRRLPSIRIRPLAFFGVSQLLLLGALSLYEVHQSLALAEQRHEAVAASQIEIARIDHAFSLLQDVEAGTRGYVITGNPVFLTPYDAAVGALRPELASLEASKDLDKVRLAGDIRRKLDYAAHISALRRDAGEAAAAREVGSLQGQALMDQVRAQRARIIDKDHAELARRNAASEDQTRRATLIIYLALGASQLLSLIVGALMLRHLRLRRDADRAAQVSMSMLKATLNSVDHGVALLDREGRLLEWNGLLETLLDLGAIERGAIVCGRQEIEGARARRPVTLERVIGESRCLEIRGQPTPEDRYVVTYTDITERRRDERLKNDFISTVSHELRTPLTAIRGALGLLAGPLSAGMPERAVDMMKIADRNAERLTVLVNDLLDIDRIESGRMTFEMAHVDLNALAKDAAETNRSFAADRGVTMAVGCPAEPVVVRADSGRLLQVMANLVSNAAKFSPSQGIVTITVEKTANRAKISVNDNGEGIPEDFQPRIFGRFAQAATGDARTTRGSGLGLSISKTIVEGHGGAIGFETRPGNTTFSVFLPLSAAG